MITNGERWGGRGNYEFGINIYTLVYIKQVNKDLLYSTVNQTQYLNIRGQNLKKNIHICVHVCASHSVASGPLQPRGLQPTRLLCPQDSPRKNTGVQGIFPTQDQTHISYIFCVCRRILYHWYHMGSHIYTYITESLWGTPETNTLYNKSTILHFLNKLIKSNNNSILYIGFPSHIQRLVHASTIKTEFSQPEWQCLQLMPNGSSTILPGFHTSIGLGSVLALSQKEDQSPLKY